MEKLINKTDALINKVLKTWDIKDLKLESIDPVIRLLIACVADESRNLEGKINETTRNIEQILLDSLLPFGLTYSRPAHAIIQALPAESAFELNDRQQFIYDKSVVVNGKKEIVPIVFTPVSEFKIFRSSVEFTFNGETLYSVKEDKSYYPEKLSENANSVWMGILMDDTVRTIERMPFYISSAMNTSISEDVSKPLLIDKIRLFIGGDRELNLEKGLNFNSSQAKNFNADIHYSYDLLSYDDLLKDSFCSYTDYLYKVGEYQYLNSPLVKAPYPEFFGELFDRDTLAVFSNKLLWLEFRFESSDPEISKKLTLIPNAFPVINVKNISVHLTRDEAIRKVPLGYKEELVGIPGYKVFDEFHYEQPQALMDDKPFLLRDIDMEKFSTTDSLDLIEKLIKRFETDYHAFHEHFSIDYDLINRLREALIPIQESAGKLKSMPDNKNRSQYLIFKPGIEEIDSLEVDCLITNGGFANNILKGEKLRSVNSLIKQDTVFFINRSREGRDRLTTDEKRKAISFMLVSNNQLVTKEDITRFCYYELGERLKYVGITDSILNGPDGLRKCIKVELQLFQSKTEAEDLPLMAIELENKIRLRSSAIVPVIVKLICV